MQIMSNTVVAGLCKVLQCCNVLVLLMRLATEAKAKDDPGGKFTY